MRLPKIGSSDINVKKSRFPTRIIPFKCLKFPYKCKLTPTPPPPRLPPTPWTRQSAGYTPR